MLRLLAVAFLAVASGNVIHDGNCPDIKTVDNFNLTAYEGIWYETSKYSNGAEKGGKCPISEYKVDGEGLKVKNSHIINGVQNFVEGTVKFDPKGNKAGKLIVSLKSGDLVKESPLHILATNYKNYAIAYSCTYDEKKKSHEDCLWILSRAKKLEPEVKTAIDVYLKNYSKELDATKLVAAEISDEACKFNSSVAITEEPKA